MADTSDRPFPPWGSDGGEARHAFEEQCRREARPTYVGDGTVLTRVLGRHLMYLDGADCRLAHHLMFDGFWESWLTIGLRSCLAPGMTVVDVGANFGYYSLLMAECVGPSGRVVAFEPQRRLSELLSRTVFGNLLGNRVEVRAAAVGDSIGPKTLRRPANLSGNGSLVKSFDGVPQQIEVEEVQCVTLDSVFGDGRVDVVKIDVEGNEDAVVAGMLGVIAANPQIQLAIELEAQGRPPVLLDVLEGEGFVPHLFNFSGECHSVTYAYVREQQYEPMVLFRRPA